MKSKEFINEEMLPDVKTYTPAEIAKKHGVSINQINKELKMGIKIEFEHTKNRELSREIALDHLLEMPNYYSKLEKMEKVDEMTSAGSVAAVASPLGSTISRNASIYKSNKKKSKTDKYKK